MLAIGLSKVKESIDILINYPYLLIHTNFYRIFLGLTLFLSNTVDESIWGSFLEAKDSVK